MNIEVEHPKETHEHVSGEVHKHCKIYKKYLFHK